MPVTTLENHLSRAKPTDLEMELRALVTLVREFTGRTGPREAVPIDEWLARATPDQLLNRWQAVRGEKAEAYLYGRIARRRTARRG